MYISVLCIFFLNNDDTTIFSHVKFKKYWPMFKPCDCRGMMCQRGSCYLDAAIAMYTFDSFGNVYLQDCRDV